MARTKKDDALGKPIMVGQCMCIGFCIAIILAIVGAIILGVYGCPELSDYLYQKNNPPVAYEAVDCSYNANDTVNKGMVNCTFDCGEKANCTGTGEYECTLVSVNLDIDGETSQATLFRNKQDAEKSDNQCTIHECENTGMVAAILGALEGSSAPAPDPSDNSSSSAGSSSEKTCFYHADSPDVVFLEEPPKEVRAEKNGSLIIFVFTLGVLLLCLSILYILICLIVFCVLGRFVFGDDDEDATPLDDVNTEKEPMKA